LKTEKYDGTAPRMVLIGMVTDRVVCGRVASQWIPEGLFDSSWMNLVAILIINYFKKYNTAPGDQLIHVFETWASETQASEEAIQAIERFLVSLNDVEQEDCSDYVLDLAGKYFNKVRLERDIEAAKIDLQAGRVGDAEARFERRVKVNLGARSYVEPAADPNLWMEAFSRDRRKPLVRFHGDYGKFVGDAFVRSSLFSYMAPDKVGKSTHLIEFAYLAVRQRNRVAFFDTGDSDVEEVMLRFALRTLRLPEYAGDYSIPSGWGPDGKLVSSALPHEEANPLEGYREFLKMCRSTNSFRLACYENSSMSAADIDGVLDDWDVEGWRPDVIVLDYADILAPLKGIRDKDDQIDETWKALRRMSQRRHCLVMTASQTSSLAYTMDDSALLRKKHFSGRKTKLAHVNGMLGINVNDKEKDSGEARINWIVRRKAKYNESHFCRIAGNYALGCPAIVSKR